MRQAIFIIILALFAISSSAQRPIEKFDRPNPEEFTKRYFDISGQVPQYLAYGRPTVIVTYIKGCGPCVKAANVVFHSLEHNALLGNMNLVLYTITEGDDTMKAFAKMTNNDKVDTKAPSVLIFDSTGHLIYYQSGNNYYAPFKSGIEYTVENFRQLISRNPKSYERKNFEATIKLIEALQSTK